MKRSGGLWMLAAFCMLSVRAIASPVRVKFEIVNQVHQAITAEMEKDQIPGITYAVFDPDGLLFSGASGVGDVGSQQKLDPALSLFRIASLSKMATSVAVMQLIQEGVISLDTHLLDLDIPFVHRLARTHQSDIERWKTLTLRQLLGHTGGISKDLPGSNMWLDIAGIRNGTYPDFTAFYRGMSDVELIYTPGKIPPGMKYSNLGFNMLARIVERYNREGLSFPRYVQKYVFAPLGMKKSHYALRKEELADLTSSYTPLGVDATQPEQRVVLPKVYDPLSYDGSVGIATTVEDLARLGMEDFKWVGMSHRSALSLGVNSEQALVELTSPYAPDLGWSLGGTWGYLPGESGADPVWFGDEGTGFGERSLLYVSPELGFGIALEFNTRDAYREKYAQIVANIVSGQTQSAINASTKELLGRVRSFLANTAALPTTVPTPGSATSDLAPYVGGYFSTILGASPVTESINANLIFMGYELETVNLAKGKFRVPKVADLYLSGEPVNFIRDNAGSVKQIIAGGCLYLYHDL